MNCYIRQTLLTRNYWMALALTKYLAVLILQTPLMKRHLGMRTMMIMPVMLTSGDDMLGMKTLMIMPVMLTLEMRRMRMASD